MIESTDELGTGTFALAKRWSMELANANKAENDWRERSKKILDRYRIEGDFKNVKGYKFNILWSNTETLKPAIYSQTPTPDVRRRYSDMPDDQADRVSTAIERGLIFSMDSYNFDGEVQRVRDDYLLPGRGIARVRYIPTMGNVKRKKAVTREEDGSYSSDGEAVDPADVKLEAGIFYQTVEQEELTYEEARCEYVNWSDFRISPAKQWTDVTWEAFRQLMSRDELVKYFGSKGNDVSLTVSSSNIVQDDKTKTPSIFNKAELWEIWDKEERKVYWFCEGYDEKILKVIDDPLELDQFFPNPEPLYSIKSNDTMIPIPEYTMYQDQAEELDILTTRLTKLVDALRAKGFYPGEQKEALDNAFKTEENTLIPIADWAAFAEKGGADGLISWIPIEQFGKVISSLYQRRNDLIQTIYDVTGISDIMRGSSDPRETKGAQELKASFGSRRTLPRAKDFQVFIRDTLRLKAEIMCKHFSAMTFFQMTGVKLTPEDMKLMRNDAMRAFKIDIETDSTVAPYDDKEKQSVSEFMQALGSFSTDIAPLVQLNVIPPEVVPSVLQWAASKFKVSRELQDVLKSAKPGPNPADQQAQQQQQQQQAEQQAAEQQQQHEQQLAQQAQAHQQALDQAEAQRKDMQAQHAMQLQGQQAELDAILKREAHQQDMRIKWETAQNNIRIANEQAKRKPAARAN